MHHGWRNAGIGICSSVRNYGRGVGVMGKETGGPAFPFTCKSEPDFYGRTNNLIRAGMTLRDYFAGQAIIPFMNWSLDQSQEDGDTAAIAAKRYAKSAYLIADAMLEARK